jgi:hypothetical protein
MVYATAELDKAFENVVAANEKAVAALNKGMGVEYSRLLKELKSILASAHEQYAVEGKLTWSELQRYKRITILETRINTAIKEGYKPIRTRILREERDILEGGYNNNIKALNLIPNVALKQTLTGKQIDAILAKPWSGLSLNDRIALRVSDLGVRINGNLKASVMGEGVGYKESMDGINKIVTRNFAETGKMIENTSYQYLSDIQQTTFQQAKDDGMDIYKTWVSAGDEKVRPAHQLLDGQTVRGDEMFEIPSGEWAGYKADGPGLFGEPALDYFERCWLVASVQPTKEEE